MPASEILLWLTKTVGGETLKSWLGRRGIQSELRTIKRALQDSQHRRDELERAADLVERVGRKRDAYFSEIVRLRAENIELREAIAQRPRQDGSSGG